MACTKKENTGNCNHPQCPYADETGMECIDIWAGYCESGYNCVPGCRWSFTDPNIQKDQLRAIDEFYGIEEQTTESIPL